MLNKSIFREGRERLTERISYRNMMIGSLAMLGLFIFSFIFVPYFALEASAESANLNITWGQVSLTLDTDADDTSTAVGAEGHGDITFGTITPIENSLADQGQSYGRLVVTKKRIGVATSGTYFTVYLSTEGNDNGLTMTNEAGLQIPATSGTWASPATFGTNGGSGWGFAVPGTTISTEIEDPEHEGQTISVTPNFSASLASSSILDTQLAYNTSGAETYYHNSVWAAVPTSGNSQQIWKESNLTSDGYGFGTYTVGENTVVSPHSDSGDPRYKSFDVYYAVAVDTNVVAGTYENEITYTALASAKSLDQVSTNLVRDLAFGGKNDTQTLRFDLNDSAASVTEDMLTVALVPHSVLAANNYTITGLDMNDYAKCPVTDVTFNTTAGYTEIACTTPDHGPELGNGGGTFDYWVNISGYNYNYVTKIDYTKNNVTSNVGAFVYAGLQSSYSTADPRYSETAGVPDKIVTKMQEMSQGICSNTNMWNNQTGANARIYDNGGTSQMASDGADDAGTVQNNAAIGTGTFALADIRERTGGTEQNPEYKKYLVRRLADGNCWMVQNLDLDLNQFGATNPAGAKSNLTPADTNISEDWDPFASTTRKYTQTVENGGYTDLAAWTGASLTSDWASLAKFIYGTASSQPRQYLLQGENGSIWGSRRESDSESMATIDGKTGNPLNNTFSEIPRSYSNTKSDGSVIYVNTNGLNGTTVSGEGTTSGMTSDTWHSANNQFYGSEYFGHYYDWYAATAETGTYSQVISDASGSICPKGWQLPVNDTASGAKSWYNLIQSNDYYDLINTDGTQTAVNTKFPDAAEPTKEAAYRMHQIPLSIPFTGYYYWVDGLLGKRGTSAPFWSSTANPNVSSLFSRQLYFYDTSINPNNNDNKVDGNTVRCVAQGEPAESPVVATCGEGEICYNGNGGTGDMSSDKHTSISSGASVTLKAPSYSREGFAFAGWSTTDGSSFGETYGPNETITAPDTIGSTGLNLYAKWLAPSGTMQDFDATACSNLGMEQTIALTDTRDGKVYTIAKLKDNNCWMTSNLALNLADFQNTNKLTSENTDLSLPEIADEENRKGLVVLARDGNGKASKVAWDPGKSTRDKITLYDAELTQLGLSKDWRGLSELLLGVRQLEQYQTHDSGTNAYQYRWGTGCTAPGVCSGSVVNNKFSEIPRSHIINFLSIIYYNWYAATAESGTFEMKSEYANDSVCPKGWQLPTDTQSNTLFGNYEDNGSLQRRIIRSFPSSLRYGGFQNWSNGAVSYHNEMATYWLSKAGSGTHGEQPSTLEALSVQITEGAAYYTIGNSKIHGFAVRCTKK